MCESLIFSKDKMHILHFLCIFGRFKSKFLFLSFSIDINDMLISDPHETILVAKIRIWVAEAIDLFIYFSPVYLVSRLAVYAGQVAGAIWRANIFD